MHEHAAISVASHSAAAHQPSLLNEPALDHEREKLPAGKTIQCSLMVGPPDDPLEDEADAMADTVMRMPLIQRKCAQCEEEQNIQRSVQLPYTIQRKCAHCEEEESIQRKTITPFIQTKSNGEESASGSLTSRINNSRGNGSSMDEGTRTFMEHGFNSDFSNITIHTGSESVQMNRELNAKAFTVGNDIYFNQNEYNPQSDSGKHLLAHELTHTIQQGAGVQRKQIQRTISPDIETIRSHLSYGVFDWAVTNGDVLAVLNFLKPLSDGDLTDTVVAMGSGMVTRLMENLAESDNRHQPWVSTLVQRIYRLSGMVPDVASLAGSLSYGLFDWAVTDYDVTNVLVQLNGLSDDNLRRVVAALEQGGYINRLYDNLAESDDQTREWVVTLMERIQRMRVFRDDQGRERADSCNPSQRENIRRKITEVREWASRMINTVVDFSIPFLSTPAIEAMMDKYFFHQAHAGNITRQQQEAFAETVIQRLTVMRTEANETLVGCASPFDSSCNSGAGAYARAHTLIRICQNFTNLSENGMTALLFHELMHYSNSEVDDTGYRGERVFAYLPPDRAINNADSYSAFAVELITGESTLRSRSDTIEGCTPEQEEKLRSDLAFAERMIRNALNEIGDNNFDVQNGNNAATSNFKATSYDQMRRFKSKVLMVQRMLRQRLAINCSASRQRTGALPFTATGENTLQLTPDYFTPANDNDRTLVMMAIMFSYFAGDMGTAVFPSEPSFGGQSIDEAYTNPAAYAGYARDISFNATGHTRSEWNFADATVRYHEELGRTREAIIASLNETYSEDIFNSTVVDFIVTNIDLAGTATPVEHHGELVSRRTSLLEKAQRLRMFLDRMYPDYNRTYLDHSMRVLLMFDHELYAVSHIHEAVDRRYRTSLRLLDASFRPLLRRIMHGEAVEFSEWTEYNELLTEFRNRMSTLEANIRSYRPYMIDLFEVRREYITREDAFMNSQAMHNAEFDDFVITASNVMSTRTEVNNRFALVYSWIVNRSFEGIPFDPVRPHLPDLQRLRRSLREMFESSARLPAPP